MGPLRRRARRVCCRRRGVADSAPRMPSATGPDLKKYMDKRLQIKLNGNRTVQGVLRGFDQFMNLVLDETMEIVSPTEQNKVGMVVIRGNSVVMIEALEKLWGD